MKTKRALVSVSDKSGIVPFVQEIDRLGFEIISTGGTAKAIRGAGIPVIDVSEVTGFPEIMDGRVKTLHPKVHGGILARREVSDHLKALEELDISLIDLVVVNLYPFQEATRDENVSLEIAIENIDIGGPAMIRASAKNYKDVAVITDPEDYEPVLKQLRETGEVDLATKEMLAIKVFHLTSRYDAAVDAFLSKRLKNEQRIHLSYTGGQVLRYGENSHQEATFFEDPDSSESSVAKGQVLHGKAMSYNNYVDANAAYEAVKDLPYHTPAVSVIKHTNPCGLATGGSIREALEMAWEGDPISAFGGVLATNAKVDMDFANFLKGESEIHYSYQVVNGEYIPQVVTTGKFVEVVIAPEFTEEAVEFLKSKSKMIRLVKVGETRDLDRRVCRSITGGLLVQTPDKKLKDKFKVSTKKEFPDSMQDLAEFTLVACKHTKSNAIILGREYAPGRFQVIGMGAGQPNRVDSMRKLAIPKAKENMKRVHERNKIETDFETFWLEEVQKMVLVSDGFFPFDDTVKEANSFGIKYIVQPGGSLRDEDSIKACDEFGIAMAFTGLRHFNH